MGSDMDWYTIFKFLHIVAALAWVGGGMTMLAQSLFAIRDRGELETLRALDAIGSMGKRWFIPASLLTVIFGVVMTSLAGLWSELWILLGLAGFASTFFTGLLVFEPMAKRVRDLVAAGRESEAVDVGRALLRIAKFDYAVMFVVVADMVLKPYWTDYATLGAMAATVVVAAALFLVPRAARPALQPAA